MALSRKTCPGPELAAAAPARQRASRAVAVARNASGHGVDRHRVAVAADALTLARADELQDGYACADVAALDEEFFSARRQASDDKVADRERVGILDDVPAQRHTGAGVVDDTNRPDVRRGRDHQSGADYSGVESSHAPSGENDGVHSRPPRDCRSACSAGA